MSEGTTEKKLVERLRAAGLRPTKQRIALGYLMFAQGDRHFTAEVLHEEAIRDDIPVSLATVYNTLHQFTQANLIRLGYRPGPLVINPQEGIDSEHSIAKLHEWLREAVDD